MPLWNSDRDGSDESDYREPVKVWMQAKQGRTR
jgi:hypothetical protein